MKQNNEKLYIGLTGGIGAGKTTAAECLKSLGADVLDADEISRQALAPNGPCVRKTVEAFGNDILNGDGTINRPALGKIVFQNEYKRLLLNKIIHPYVVHEMLKRAEASEKEIVVFDVPLLYECGLDKLMDAVIAVSADLELRIRRVMARNNCTRESVLERIAAQKDQQKRFVEADFTLDNGGSKEALYQATEKLLNTLRERKK